MGQNLFSRHLGRSSSSYSHKNDSYEAKHHKENYAGNGKTTVNMSGDDVPPNKKRRVFSSEISPVKREPMLALRNSAVADHMARSPTEHTGKQRLRNYARLSLNGSTETKPLAEKRVNRSSPKETSSSVKKLLERNSNSFHELRSSKKCSWIKEGPWMVPATSFNPPTCPENLTCAINLSLCPTEKPVVEVPCFRRYPVRPLGKGSPLRLNGLTHKIIKAKGKRPSQLFEDTTDDCFCRRHRKSEDLEKRIVRWDRQRQRELEYYEYLKAREAQRKTSQFAPNLHYTSSVNSAASSVISPSTKPGVSSNTASTSSDSSMWPSIEDIQFIEILPSNRSLVQVTLFGRPLPSADTKAGFSLPWAVNPSVVAPSNPSRKASAANSVFPKTEIANRPKKVARTKTRLQKVNAAKAKVIKATRRKEENLKPSTSSTHRRSSSPTANKRSLVSRSLSLPIDKSVSPKHLEGMLMTRHGLYAKPETQSTTVRRRLSLPIRRRSLRIR